jgi:hypothetical protein
MKPILIASLLVTACAGDDGGSITEQEVITTVVLTFLPNFGAIPPVTFEFDDPDGDGGDPPIVDPIVLAEGEYILRVAFENRLETPAEDITLEIADEAEDHLVLFTGTAPLEHEYSDMDANGLPIGLENLVTATVGSGELTVTLRHMPPELPPVKDAATVDLALTEGIDAIGGSTDAQVTFPVTVQ